jgi:hypothetical protein
MEEYLCEECGYPVEEHWIEEYTGHYIWIGCTEVLRNHGEIP